MRWGRELGVLGEIEEGEGRGVVWTRKWLDVVKLDGVMCSRTPAGRFRDEVEVAQSVGHGGGQCGYSPCTRLLVCRTQCNATRGHMHMITQMLQCSKDSKN